MNRAGKERLDVLVFQRGFADSRHKAQAMILAGQIVVGEHTQTKAGCLVPVESEIRLKGQAPRYVSRGGLKLEGALEDFKVDPTDTVCLDVGASTGGFTDCLLQHGAKKVYSVDVGTNQLAWKLRQDERVVSIERCHIKNLTTEHVPEPIDWIVADVSFISIAQIMPDLLRFCCEGTRMLLLVKPQFEAGREFVGKGGVVRDERGRQEAVGHVLEALPPGWETQGPLDCRVHGPKGNRELFLLCYQAKSVGQEK